MLKINEGVILSVKYVEFKTNQEGIDYIKAKGFITQKALSKTNQKKINTHDFFSSIKIFGERAYLDEIATRLWGIEDDNPIIKLNLKEAYVSNVVYNKILRSELLVIQSNFQKDKYKFDIKKEHRVYEYMAAPLKYTKEPEVVEPKVKIKKEIVYKEKKVKVPVIKEKKVIVEKPVKKIIYIPKEVKKQQTWEDVKENIKQNKNKDREEKIIKEVEAKQEIILEKLERNIYVPKENNEPVDTTKENPTSSNMINIRYY